MKARTTPQSGKHGNSVSFKGRYGQVERDYVIPKNPATFAQMRPRMSMSRIAGYWRKLTEPQRQAWIAGGANLTSRPNLGQCGPLTGCAFFVQINCQRAAINLPMLLDPPERPQFPVNPVGELVISNASGDINLKLSVSGAPAEHIMVLGAAPCSAGVAYVDHFVILGLLPAPTDGFSDISDMYIGRYGKPPVGSKIVILTKQQVNGWVDQPQEARAIVPAA
jgi:hypothetical protein